MESANVTIHSAHKLELLETLIRLFSAITLLATCSLFMWKLLFLLTHLLSYNAYETANTLRAK